ncbi:MAG: RNA methyltransferase [Actinomycetia bacterium]|nr:RNA methyltransferase [Actinomycetes bacterium]MCH9800598.1 RNA methyltransferase [Actinomycetes bacterium]
MGTQANGNQPQGPTSVKSDRVRALRRLSQRSFRQQVKKFLAEGPQAVREAVRHRPDVVVEIYLAEDAADASRAIANEARTAGLPVIEVPEAVLLALTETVHPQGIAAVCSYLDSEPTELLAKAKLVVLLDRVRDPGNAGTILRTADAAGADAVLLSSESVDLYNGKCVRSSAGSLFHVPVATGVAAAATLASARTHDLQVLAADVAGELSLPEADDVLAGPTLWVFGNEAHGLAAELATAVDHRVSIPIVGAAESLNLSAAAAVCLYASAFARSS